MKRLIVMNLGATPITLINPEITWRSEYLLDVAVAQYGKHTNHLLYSLTFGV
jgi:hypothetical protein